MLYIKIKIYYERKKIRKIEQDHPKFMQPKCKKNTKENIQIYKIYKIITMQITKQLKGKIFSLNRKKS